MTNTPTRWLRATRAFLNELLPPKVRRGIYALFAAWAGIIAADATFDEQPIDAARRALFAAVLLLAAAKTKPGTQQPQHRA